MGTQCDLTTPGGRTLSEHDNSDYGDENIVGLLYKPPFKANDFSCPAFSKPSVKSLAGHGVIKASCSVLNFFPYFFHIPSSWCL